MWAVCGLFGCGVVVKAVGRHPYLGVFTIEGFRGRQCCGICLLNYWGLMPEGP